MTLLDAQSSRLRDRARVLGRALLLVAAALLSACASLPRVGPLLADPALDHATPQVVGAHGPLSPAAADAVLARLRRQGGDTDILQRHLALEQAVSGTPLYTGNRVHLLVDGPQTYGAMYRAIDAARSSIDLETYIMDDDAVGRHFAALLIKARQRGVRVNLMYDGIGSIDTPASFFQAMAAHGIRVLEFNPVDPFKARHGWNLNHRDHRKIMVIDGRIGFTGGVNISSVYSHGSFAHLLHHRRPPGTTPWRDTQVEVEGPAVAALQRLFMDTWASQGGPPLDDRDYFPALPDAGNEVVRVIGSGPYSKPSLMYVTMVSAINSAETSIDITNAYFVPDSQLLHALEAAARRGVRVRLILPSQSDFWAPLYAGRAHFTALLKAGVQIWERRDALLHAKTAVIDGVWSTVGSTNLDWRSFLHNNEANVVVLGRAFGNRMEAMFERDLRDSTRIELAQWRHRPAGSRIREWLARLISYWL